MPWLPWGEAPDAEAADWPEDLMTTPWPALWVLRTVLMTTEGFKPGGIVWE